MLYSRMPRIRSLLFAATLVTLPGAAAAPASLDLGAAPAGTIDTFEIETRNASCEAPQDFRFVPNNLPWLKLVNGDMVREVARGKTKMFVAKIDLTGLKPGRYAGHLDIECDTCRVCTSCSVTVIPACRIDLSRLALALEVVAGGESRPSDVRPPPVSATKP